jgi:hypothetical protein
VKRAVGFLPLLAWIVSLVILRAAPSLQSSLSTTTLLPRVATQTTQTDVTSNVEALFIVLTLSLLCCLIVEPSKFFTRSATTRGPLLYSCLLIFQGLLVAETIRVNINDWWLWALGALRIAQRAHSPDPLAATQPHFAWLSLTLSVLIAIVWWKTSRMQPRGTHAHPPDARTGEKPRDRRRSR